MTSIQGHLDSFGKVTTAFPKRLHAYVLFYRKCDEDYGSGDVTLIQWYREPCPHRSSSSSIRKTRLLSHLLRVRKVLTHLQVKDLQDAIQTDEQLPSGISISRVKTTVA